MGEPVMNLHLVDTARGAYARSPYFVRRSLAPLVSLLPADIKFGRSYRDWRLRIAQSAADPASAHAMQRAALRGLLARAHAGSPFYRELIDQGFGPGFDAETVELADIRRLPILGKAELRAAGTQALTAPKWQLDFTETSGSNAEKPFGFYLDKDRSAREMAFVYSVWSRVGYDEYKARACFRGYGLDPFGSRIYEWEPALKELKLSVFPMTPKDVALYLDLIDRHRVQYLYGYMSAIELFCRHLKALGRTPALPIKGILPISEPIFEHQRRAIRDVLGEVPIAAFYGLSEKVLFAAELPGDNGIYEFEPLYGLAEIVDDAGEPITCPGREGRLIGTGFLSTGMPFIRYDTGDRARLEELPSAANGYRLRVSSLNPRRKPDYLVGADGNRVVAIDLTPAEDRLFEGVDEFQFFQDTPGEVLIRYVTSRDATGNRMQRLAKILQKKSHGRLRFSSVEVESIASGRGGKRAFVDQQLLTELD
jgi:phenylacetate-CoA ligase